MKLELATKLELNSSASLLKWARMRTEALRQHEDSELRRRERMRKKGGANATQQRATPLTTQPAVPPTEQVGALPTKEKGGRDRQKDRRGRSPAATKRDSRASSPAATRRSPSPGAANRRPDAKFVGCWYCGKVGCQRQTCPAYLAGREKNGGKHVEGA